jgi:hypothetical protein
MECSSSIVRSIPIWSVEKLVMLNTLCQIGLTVVSAQQKAASERSVAGRQHPLAAYPTLLAVLHNAERSGTLAAERRSLEARRRIY